MTEKPASIKDRLEVARQLDYVSVQQAALLVGVSIKTIWRRVPHLTGPADVLRSNRIVRVRRHAILRLFGRQ